MYVYREIHEDPPGSVVVVLDHGGRSLDRIIEDRGALPLPEVFDVTAQIAHALDYAHERNVMHQDVKPQNVLMQELRRGWDVRLADFGISILGRTGRRTNGARTVVASKLIGFTPFYAAPEQWQGIPARSSDQYSLALVVCSMLEGRVFAERYRMRRFSQLSDKQNEVLERALSVHPEQRFDSCEDFVRSLRGRQ